MLKLAATFCAVFLAISALSPRLKHATAGLAAAVACAWAVLLARALVPLVSVAPAWASPALGEWVSLVEE